ncbi:MAG: prephenate dehydrogenase/arogenate dehydrogenase family protein [Proteobacteria bacterium]|nr:prephenate dehydrogenase/arogenate dehydrogenase family protein [Pseudomonadota bacterium]
MRLGTLAIVGVGLIGGSIGKAAKQRGLVERIVGVEPDPDSALWAVENRVLDAVAAEVPAEADLIALCVPSDLVAQWVITLADHPATIFDVGSVKSPIIKEIEVTHTPPPRFVPCHPISGSEKSGPQAADGDLFDGCTVVLTPLANTASAAQQACASFWEALGASLVSMTADEHDAALAVTSHLPHLLAFAFMGQVTDQHLPLTGGGFRDFSRIAAANPELWWRIMQLNQGALSQALEDYSNNLRALAAAIESGDESQGLALIEAAAQKRRAADATAQ